MENIDSIITYRRCGIYRSDILEATVGKTTMPNTSDWSHVDLHIKILMNNIWKESKIEIPVSRYNVKEERHFPRFNIWIYVGVMKLLGDLGFHALETEQDVIELMDKPMKELNNHLGLEPRGPSMSIEGSHPENGNLGEISDDLH